MDIWQTDKLLLFIGFIVPGFVSLKTYELLLPSEAKESTKQLIDAIAYSCVNYALLFLPISFVEHNQLQITHPIFYIAFYVFALLFAPVIWAALFVKLRSTQFLQKRLPHPTGKPWDFVFGQRRPFWVIVTLKDGERIAGRYDESSFASSAPHTNQLFLQESWVLTDEGGFDRPRKDTAGIMILGPEIVTVEFFEITYGEYRDDQN